MDQKAVQFILLAAFVLACFAAGTAGFFLTPRLVGAGLARLRQRRLEGVVPFLSGVFRVLFFLLAALSGYLLTKLPFLYRCVFK